MRLTAAVALIEAIATAWLPGAGRPARRVRCTLHPGLVGKPRRSRLGSDRPALPSRRVDEPRWQRHGRLHRAVRGRLGALPARGPTQSQAHLPRGPADRRAAALPWNCRVGAVRGQTTDLARSVADPNDARMSHWRPIAGAVLLDLAVSPLFAWAVFTPRLSRELGVDQPALATVFSVGLAAFTVGVLVLSLIHI